MHAAAVFGVALVYATFVRRLILTIGTILAPVTDLRQGNTLSASTVELAAGIAALEFSCDPAVAFIAAIGTILQSIASEVSGNAAAIAALKLIRPASDISAV